MAEHGAFAAPGGAAGVDDGGQVIGAAVRGFMGLAKLRRARQQRAAALVVEREHMARAGRKGELADPAEVARSAYQQRGLGVFDEVLQLGRLVSRVERQKDMARAQHRQVEHQ